ncbi:hypothetical protein [Methylobacterium sp. R2-1]|uniref:hypothetical protein n=1 Tax=Methylobacterium sp. R2-1 TaxID=2587064 RepID=UPI001619C7F6|nr:hypothetical protein [Methylobacterium sp. R2-1]MBB2963760.1 hypothetical protein [Methylobacterium sp. R2-1]
MRDEETLTSQVLALEIVVVTLVEALDEFNKIPKAEVAERILLLSTRLRASSNLELTQKVGAEMVRIADSVRHRIGAAASEG